MSDEWTFWREQLVGAEPKTTPGTPHAGYYINRNRQTYRNPEPGVGKPRHKVNLTYEPCAIWKDETGWHCLIHGKEGTRYTQDVEQIDYIFSRVCRTAVPHDEYLSRVEEFEKDYAHEYV